MRHKRLWLKCLSVKQRFNKSQQCINITNGWSNMISTVSIITEDNRCFNSSFVFKLSLLEKRATKVHFHNFWTRACLWLGEHVDSLMNTIINCKRCHFILMKPASVISFDFRCLRSVSLSFTGNGFIFFCWQCFSVITIKLFVVDEYVMVSCLSMRRKNIKV